MTHASVAAAVVTGVMRRSRRKKWGLYVKAFPPVRGEHVLDVGVSALDIAEENYFLDRYPYPDQITAVGIDDVSDLRDRYPSVTFRQADGRALPYADDSFDVVHSNAVVEHVGDREQQRIFISELVRVARTGGFVTTPNRWFPIEAHTRAPFLHWLPRSAFVHVLKRTGRVPVVGDWNTWLLSARQFLALFPPQVRVTLVRGRMLGVDATLNVLFSKPRG